LCIYQIDKVSLHFNMTVSAPDSVHKSVPWTGANSTPRHASLAKRYRRTPTHQSKTDSEPQQTPGKKPVAQRVCGATGKMAASGVNQSSNQAISKNQI